MMSKYFNKIGFLSLLSLLFIGFVACDDDDKVEGVKDLYEIIVDKPNIYTSANQTVTVNIVLGNGEYVVKSYDTSIATASVSGDVVTIKTGIKEGTTTVEVRDQENVIGNISVGVGDFEIGVNYPEGMEIILNSSDELKIHTGNFTTVDDLTIEITDPSIINMTPIDLYRPYYKIDALKLGETFIVIKDKLGKEFEVKVSVTLIPLKISLDENIINLVNDQKLPISILQGYAPYTLTVEDPAVANVQMSSSGDNKLGITGLQEGETEVVLKDAYEQEVRIQVKVGKVDEVAHIGTSQYFQIGFGGNTLIEKMNSITYEARVFINALNGSTDARINTVMGVEKIFLLRIDVRKGAENEEERFLQLAADSKGSVRYEGSSKIEVGKWYDVAVVLDGSKSGDDRIRLYVNGVAETFGYKSGTPNSLVDISLKDNFFIGQSGGTQRRLNGAISYARIWNKALDATEIANHITSGVDYNHADLTAAWSFVKTAETVASYSSLTVNDGMIATASTQVKNWVTDPNLQ